MLKKCFRACARALMIGQVYVEKTGKIKTYYWMSPPQKINKSSPIVLMPKMDTFKNEKILN